MKKVNNFNRNIILLFLDKHSNLHQNMSETFLLQISKYFLLQTTGVCDIVRQSKDDFVSLLSFRWSL